MSDEFDETGDRADLPAEAGGHIFVSYKSEDRVAFLAEAFERRGWPVWWDRDIRVGESFRKVIAGALSDASCVVVVWTQKSVDSEWVQEEAQEARRRGILVPAVFDDVPQPLGFGQVQAANIVGWDGQPDAPILDELLAGVATRMGFDSIPPLLDDKEWAAIQKSTLASAGRAAAKHASQDKEAARTIKAAAREREAADAADELARALAVDDSADDVARSLAAAEAGEQRQLAKTAEDAASAAEERAAEASLERAADRAVAVRAAAAKAAERDARAQAAEDAAERAEAERIAAASAGEQEAAAKAVERAAEVKAAEEKALAAEEAAARASAQRAGAARVDKKAATQQKKAAKRAAKAPPAPRQRKKRRWGRRFVVLILVGAIAAAGVGAFLYWQDQQVDGGGGNDPGPSAALNGRMEFNLFQGEEESFFVEVPPDGAELIAETSGSPSPDVDLFVTAPTGDVVCASESEGNAEFCRVPVTPGRWSVRVRNFAQSDSPPDAVMVNWEIVTN